MGPRAICEEEARRLGWVKRTFLKEIKARETSQVNVPTMELKTQGTPYVSLDVIALDTAAIRSTL